MKHLDDELAKSAFLNRQEAIEHKTPAFGTKRQLTEEP
jgi:hypothetical protein